MRNAASILLIIAATSPGVGAEPSPVRVTTDTLEYCGALAQRLHALPAAREEPALTLGADGQRLCANGHVRTGVAKLRRALRAAQAAPVTPPPQPSQSSQLSGR